MLAVVAARPDIVAWADDAGNSGPSSEPLPLEQLAQVIAMELQVEDRRAAAQMLSFHEFQDVTELECGARIVYLMNQTLVVRDQIQNDHREVLGIAGMFLQLLQSLPEENSWVWALTNLHQHFMQQLHTYWSKVVTVALDEHQCLIAPIRDVILEAVIRWKKLHSDFVAMQWNSFAFGAYSDPTLLQRLGGESDTVPGFDRGQLSGRVSDTISAGILWMGSTHDWFTGYAQDLARVLLNDTGLSAGDSETGATRLHHQDEQGSFVTYEFLRRKVFGQWAIDKGLLRGLIRHVWKPPLGSSAPVSVADFGAGGGHYSTWLNETGLVQAYAFDGTRHANELTGGVVQEINLVEDMRLWRNFSWVMCLEVGEHIPEQYSSGLLRNLRSHAVDGLVMSWSDDWEGIGHVNCLSREEFVAKVEGETGMVLDRAATEAVKASCEIDYIARTIAVFRAQQ